MANNNSCDFCWVDLFLYTIACSTAVAFYCYVNQTVNSSTFTLLAKLIRNISPQLYTATTKQPEIDRYALCSLALLQMLFLLSVFDQGYNSSESCQINLFHRAECTIHTQSNTFGFPFFKKSLLVLPIQKNTLTAIHHSKHTLPYA